MPTCWLLPSGPPQRRPLPWRAWRQQRPASWQLRWQPLLASEHARALRPPARHTAAMSPCWMQPQLRRAACAVRAGALGGRSPLFLLRVCVLCLQCLLPEGRQLVGKARAGCSYAWPRPSHSCNLPRHRILLSLPLQLPRRQRAAGAGAPAQARRAPLSATIACQVRYAARQLVPTAVSSDCGGLQGASRELPVCCFAAHIQQQPAAVRALPTLLQAPICRALHNPASQPAVLVNQPPQRNSGLYPTA